ncbi:TonB-dependent receptor [Asticcacaulis machinosus]|uniref:TonB-dependent receptor n=1 Tax=Asticcacaulis machinosus TaxID=2984211 RepID=A0ABT5HIR6_9CAUL|nr:TonB-dependent receptor [Asticcacaulis machinosus]MDC7676139.1 TonB-dependent receptor [Asticcacaulis machinosus]
MLKHKSRLLMLAAGTSLLALTLGAPSYAQTAEPEAGEDTQTVVVTARRKALQSATERKRNSDTLIDSVVADDAGKLPDNSITEVLQRVSGVTMVRFAALNNPDAFSVEGSGVQIRGLSGVAARLNGREVFSANGGTGLSWGDVTPELMAAVDVYKASRADQIEGGTGGSIDLRTKMPFDYRKPSFEASLGASYGDFAEKTSPSGSFLWTDRWDTSIGEMGLLLDVAYSEFASKSNFLRTEPFFAQRTANGNTADRYIPRGFNYGDSTFNRTREGFYEGFQWRPNDQLTIFQTAFISKYTSDNTESGVFFGHGSLGVAPGSNAEFDSNGMLIKADRLVPVSFFNGQAGETMSQTWLPANQRVNCNAPFGSQAQSLNWNTSPPSCSPVLINVGSTRGFQTSETMTADFSTGFTWTPTDKLRIDGALQFVDSSLNSTNFNLGLENPAVPAGAIDLTGDMPKFTILDGGALSNRANYNWGSIITRPQNNHGTLGAVSLDVGYIFDEGFFQEAKFGIRYADRLERDNYEGTYWAPLGRGWNNSGQRTIVDGPEKDSELYTFGDFFRGDAQLPGLFWLPSEALIQGNDPIDAQRKYGYDQECATNVYNANKTCAVDNPNREPARYTWSDDAFGFQRVEVVTRSAYLQTKFGSDEGVFGVPFTGNMGLRVVQNRSNSSGYFVMNSVSSFYFTQADFQADLADGTLNNALSIPTAGYERVDGIKYTRVLPSFNVNFKVTDDFQIRVAVNKTMSPPNYSDLRSTGSAGISLQSNPSNIPGPGGVTYPGIYNGMTANTGNPRLEPTMSTNYDLAFEWYPSYSLNAHLSLFHKDLKDLIIYGSTLKPVTFNYLDGAGTERTYTGTVSTSEVYNSSEDARISGFEIGGRKFFDELPEPWNGLGIEANYTYIDSESPSALARDIYGNPMTGIPVVGLSEHNYNVQLMYEKKNLSLRAAWSWRSEYLQSTNANGTNPDYDYYTPQTTGNSTLRRIDTALPTYADAYGQLDLGANYKVNDNVRIWLQANNVTNEVTRTLMGGYPSGQLYTRSWFIADRRINIGLNLAF